MINILKSVLGQTIVPISRPSKMAPYLSGPGFFAKLFDNEAVHDVLQEKRVILDAKTETASVLIFFLSIKDSKLTSDLLSTFWVVDKCLHRFAKLLRDIGSQYPDNLN